MRHRVRLKSGSLLNDFSPGHQRVYNLAPADGYINGAKQWDQRMIYDSLSRLSTAAEYQQGNSSQLTWQAHYDFDRYGNRYQYQNNTNVGYVPVQTSDVDSTRNRFISQSWAPMSYDPAGNITSDGKFGGMNYGYDANSRMTQASRTDGSGQSTTVYDCAGQRVQTTIAGITRQMVYDAFGQLLAEYKQGLLDKEYLYRGAQLLAINDVGGSQTNLALGKTATQSSTFVNAGITFSASRAVDGNTNGDFWGGNTSSATNYEYQPWWQVDLGSSQSITSIQVWPRTDCCPEMTSNFYVLVSDNPFTSTDLTTTLNQSGVSSYYVSGYAGTPATVNVNRTGRYVRVWKSDTQYLVLAEVQVWGSSGSTGLKYVNARLARLDACRDEQQRREQPDHRALRPDALWRRDFGGHGLAKYYARLQRHARHSSPVRIDRTRRRHRPRSHALAEV